jgi:ATP-dependent DNA helicase RecQ
VYRELLREGSDSIDDWQARGVSVNGARAALDLLRRAEVIQPDGSIHRLSGAPVDFDEQALLKANAYARVNQVMEYAGFRGCRHARIADYFGEQGVARTCMACDNCLDTNSAPYAAVDPAHVTAVLACVTRFDGHLGGVRIASILRGSTDAWTASRQWVTELKSFGALRGWELERIRELLERLVELGCLSRGHGEKPTLGITALGSAVLRGEESLDVDVRASRATRPAAGRKSSGGNATSLEMSPDVAARFQTLRVWRLETARRTEVPPYVVFHDRTLAEIAHRQPASSGALASIPGVGPAKLERYGESVLAIIREADSP